MPCVGCNVHVHTHTRTHTRIPLSRDALAERRDMSEVSSGLGQRKEGVLMLKLPQVFWLSCAWMERKSSWEALRLTLYGNHTPAAVSRTLPLDLSWNRFTKQLLGPHRSTRVSLLYISISQTPKLLVCAVSQVLVLWAFSRNFSTHLIAWTFILL